jgi:hypothetical protein
MAHPQPVIHRSKGNLNRKRYDSIIDEFSKTMKMRVKQMLVEGKLPDPILPTLDNLLNMRTALVASIRKGMLERQDQEELIGVLAALIWFNRLEEDRQARIVSMW